MADLVIYRGADGLGESAIVERGGDGLLLFDDVAVADAVQFVGGDARLDMGFDHIQYVGGQPSGHPHFLDFFRGFYCDAHSAPAPGKMRGNEDLGSCLGIAPDKRFMV